MQERAQTNADVPQALFSSEELQSLLQWTLLIVGMILVCFAFSIGQLATQNCNPQGNCGWSQGNVDAAALTCRIAGALIFAAGLVERLILGLTRAMRKLMPKSPTL